MCERHFINLPLHDEHSFGRPARFAALGWHRALSLCTLHSAAGIPPACLLHIRDISGPCPERTRSFCLQHGYASSLTAAKSLLHPDGCSFLPLSTASTLQHARTLARSLSVCCAPSSVLHPLLLSPHSFSPDPSCTHHCQLRAHSRSTHPDSGTARRALNRTLDPGTLSRSGSCFYVSTLLHACSPYLVDLRLSGHPVAALRFLSRALHGTCNNVFWKETRGRKVQEK